MTDHQRAVGWVCEVLKELTAALEKERQIRVDSGHTVRKATFPLTRKPSGRYKEIIDYLASHGDYGETEDVEVERQPSQADEDIPPEGGPSLFQEDAAL